MELILIWKLEIVKIPKMLEKWLQDGESFNKKIKKLLFHLLCCLLQPLWTYIFNIACHQVKIRLSLLLECNIAQLNGAAHLICLLEDV